MNEAEQRRQRLLAETRARYSDSMSVPAIHPRYRTSYQRIYGQEDATGSSLGARLALSLFLFALFVTMDTNHQKIKDIGTEQITSHIESTWFFIDS